MGWAKRSVFKSPWWPLGSSLLQNASLLQPLPQVSPSVCCPAVGLLLLGAGSGVPGRAAPCTTRPGLDPRGPLPGLALWRQGHPTGRRSPICLGPQLGRLETFPGLLPHLGVLVIGAFSNFCTEATGFSRTFPGLCPHLLMLPCWFHLPLFRDYIMCSGLVSSAKASAAYLLSRPGGGQVAVLAVGGPLEALEAKPGALSLRIRNQKGFVKLALEHGRGPDPGAPDPAAQPGAGGRTARAVRGEAHGAVRRAQRALWDPGRPAPRPHLGALPPPTSFLLDASVTGEGGIGIKGPFLALVLFCLLFTSLWPFSVLYFAWLFLDRHTPNQGGRRCEWTRNWTVWKHLRDYHPIKLVKTVELPPDRNYVFVSHPHGIMCIGSSCNFATEGTGFSRQFPGIHPSLAVLNLLFYFPVFRDYLMLFGELPAGWEGVPSGLG
ncbi:2-acylglycerol O-acyltransferase 3 isoform X1 [Phyllostomus discolor]|uniref:Acyltransferase n=1 Tax=Phyllostomus discolor TaxID=89673 RepID=A0A7E6DBC1_9CHIR|nr:2-acylglycerol O-acyltransferase 3 isoform X1 [Phyllostomus discolor]